MAEQNGSSRMDRIEQALELLIADHVRFDEEHKRLLTAQVVLTDRVDKLAIEQKALAMHTNEKFAEVAERFAATDDRLNALITIVDGFIRRPPGPERL